MFDWFSQRDEVPEAAETDVVEAKAPAVAEPAAAEPEVEIELQDTKEEFVSPVGVSLALENAPAEALSLTSSTREKISTERLKEATNKAFVLNKSDAGQRVGMGLMQRKNGLAVVAIAPDCLAAKAGIRVGHRILTIDGKSPTVDGANKMLSAAVGPINLDVLVPPARPPMKPAPANKKRPADWSATAEKAAEVSQIC
jgi:C-terminal processing protease CtpA/Prc